MFPLPHSSKNREHGSGKKKKKMAKFSSSTVQYMHSIWRNVEFTQPAKKEDVLVYVCMGWESATFLPKPCRSLMFKSLFMYTFDERETHTHTHNTTHPHLKLRATGFLVCFLKS